jgi:hypothetical protein
MENITKMMSTVLRELQLDQDQLWRRIERVIVMSVISAIGFISKGIRESRQVHATFFQLFGFDILIDSDMRPKVLEVNYRPSLCSDIPPETQLKRDMIRDICHIVRPTDKPKASQLSESWDAWQRFTADNPPTRTRFAKIFPAVGKRQQRYNQAIAAMRQANTEWDTTLPNCKVPARIEGENVGPQGKQPTHHRGAVGRQSPSHSRPCPCRSAAQVAGDDVGI